MMDMRKKEDRDNLRRYINVTMKQLNDTRCMSFRPGGRFEFKISNHEYLQLLDLADERDELENLAEPNKFRELFWLIKTFPVYGPLVDQEKWNSLRRELIKEIEILFAKHEEK